MKIGWKMVGIKVRSLPVFDRRPGDNNTFGVQQWPKQRPAPLIHWKIHQRKFIRTHTTTRDDYFTRFETFSYEKVDYKLI